MLKMCNFDQVGPCRRRFRARFAGRIPGCAGSLEGLTIDCKDYGITTQPVRGVPSGKRLAGQG
jgi:hypothetical protein